MTKYVSILVFLLGFGFSQKSLARPVPFFGFEKGQTAFSVLGGQPTIVRYDHFLDWKRSLNFDAGYHFDGYTYFGVNYTTYFYDVKDRYRKKDFFNSLMFYAGPGFFLGPDFKTKDDTKKLKVGIRGFIGSEYLFLGTKYSMKAEVGPAYFVRGQDDKVGFQAMVGFAYYFGGFTKIRPHTNTEIIGESPEPIRENNKRKPRKRLSPEEEKAFKEFGE
jgi:hypothetical protein